MGTVVETLHAAVDAAHPAVDGNRVNTFLEIDDGLEIDEPARKKVERTEAELGRPARCGRPSVRPNRRRFVSA